MLDWKLHIESKPEVLFGKPVILNTRISVDIILEKLALGETIDGLLLAYPKLKKEDVFACLLFASEVVKNEIVLAKAS